MSGHTIGQAAQLAGVNVETIRFYERKGLIAQPDKPRSGFREYTADAVSRIQFIKRAQALGFTLAETQELLDLSMTGDCDDVRGRAEAKLDEVEAKIKDLQRVRRALKAVVGSCTAREELDPCPLLTSLQGRA